MFAPLVAKIVTFVPLHATENIFTLFETWYPIKSVCVIHCNWDTWEQSILHSICDFTHNLF